MDNLNWMAKLHDGRAVSFENRTRILAVTTARGTGGNCAYCGKRIDPLSVEHRIQAIVRGGVRTLHFHRVCHHLWESHEQDQFGGSASAETEAHEFEYEFQAPRIQRSDARGGANA
jgi:hypothetical protein